MLRSLRAIPLVLTILLASCGQAVPSPLAPNVTSARLESLRGMAEVKEGEDWKAVARAELAAGADVRTGDEVVAELIFADGSVARLAPGSSVRLEALPVSPRQRGTELRLFGGEVWSTVLRVAGSEADYAVRTENALSYVRGTTFDVALEGTSTHITVFESRVSVESGGQTVSAAAGNAVRAHDGTLQEAPAATLASNPWFTQNARADAAYLERAVRDTALGAFYGVDLAPQIEELREAYQQTVAPPPGPADFTVASAGPLTLAGTYELLQADAECSFADAPRTTGTVALTVDTSAGTAEARFTGGGEGERRGLVCGPGAGNMHWRQQYEVTARGTVAPDGTLDLTGEVRGQATVTWAGCTWDGTVGDCPDARNGESYSFPVTLRGRFADGRADGTIEVGKILLKTGGTWSAS